MCKLVWCAVIGLGAAPPADTRTVQELIRSLGADDFRVREDATRRLMRRQDAADALQAALGDSDVEVRRRAGRVLAALRTERAGEVGRLTGRLLRSGRLDLAAALIAEEDSIDRKSERWPEVTGTASGLYREELKRGIRPPLGGAIDIWLKGLEPVHEGVVQRAPAGDQPGIIVSGGAAPLAERLVRVNRRAIMSAAGGPKRRLDLTLCLVINAGGSARYEQAFRSVIVCEGDVTLRRTTDCVIIARGRVRIEGPVYGTTILTHAEVDLARPNFVSMSTLPQHANVIREHQRGPLSGIRFFELDEFGLVMARGTDVARAVLPGVFHDAGLRPGDTIVSVGGEKAAHAEVIRSLFMRHFLRPGPVFLKVKRAGETRTLYVNIPEPLKAP
jgi:hypothetical protein